MNRHYKTLELDKILDLLANETTIKDSYEAAQNIEPSTNIFEVEEALKQTGDAHMLIGRIGAPSFYGIKNILNHLRRAEAGGCLNQRELLDIASVLRAFRLIKEWKKKSASIESSLDMYFSNIYTNKNLEEKIFSIIINEEELSDNASPELHDIRRKMRVSASKAREILEKIIKSSTYQKYLQESIITQRDGRFVVPVKAEYRNNISGLVHDTSSSGSTVFIEPMGVVNANNDIKLLKSKEEIEIEKILFDLSISAGNCADEISFSFKNACDLDLIFAKAQLAYKMNASLPKINDDGIIDIKNGRHPLISSDKVVPTNITLGEKYSTLIITGPNTGGKTVSIKTIGILTLMTLCGLMIPANENSKISIFKRILVDIGDEQNIEQSLSTFSSHMTNIVQILKLANKKSLVLLDELGAGTDPVEGAALAMAILEELRQKGATIASTTHYAELKEYALKTEGIENGCCEFDVKTLKPTYKLLIGIPGKSNAFAISSQLGIDESVITRAKKLVTNESREFENIVEVLEDRRQEVEKELKKARELTIKAEQKEREAQEKLNKAKREAEREIEKSKEEAQRLTAKTKAQAYAIIDELDKARKQNKLTTEEKSKLKKDILSLEEKADPITQKKQNDYKLPRPLKVNDDVLIFDIDKKATVLEEEHNGYVLVQAGIIKTRVKIDNLRLLDKKNITIPKTPERQITKNVSRTSSTEIDVRGETAVEAIINLDQAIDNCVLTNTHLLTVIHGKGTGVLRSEIHKHLKKHKYVKSFRLGTFGEGESGVTIIEIKS